MATIKRCDINTNEKHSFLLLLYEITIIRCIIKWLIRFFTGTCEIQRIIKNHNGGIRTLKLGKFYEATRTIALTRNTKKQKSKPPSDGVWRCGLTVFFLD